MHQSGAQTDGSAVSDAENTRDPYTDGEVPADADISDTSVSAEEVGDLLPGGSRLDEGEDDPGLDSDDVRPASGTATP